MTDEDLARQSQDGDLAAFEELVRRYENRIYSFVFQSCGHDADAREVTQDTFVRAFAALAKYDPNRPFASWLFTIARRKGIDCFRARIPTDGQSAPEGFDLDDPAELLARREEAQDLWRRARRWLPDSQFQALWLRYAEEMDVAQIARVLGKTQTHVKVLLFRARNKMAAEWETGSCAPLVPSPREAGRVLGRGEPPLPSPLLHKFVEEREKSKASPKVPCAQPFPSTWCQH